MIFSCTREQITVNESAQYDSVIYKDIIAWFDMRNGNWDIYMYNITSGNEYQITTNESTQADPAIYGDRIVWMDGRNGNLDVYMFTLETPAEAICELKESVDVLHDVNASTQKILNVKLDKVINKLDKEDYDKAIKKLEDFIKFVNEMVEEGRLDTTQADILIDKAEKIIDLIRNLEG